MKKISLLPVFLFLLFFFLLSWSACTSSGDYSPKPRGYFRIYYPAKSYVEYKSDAPFTFNYPAYATIVPDTAAGAKPYWMDVAFPQFNGRIHLSYHTIDSKKTFDELIEDARKFAFKHTVKATSIDEGTISYPDKKVYGTYYAIDGNTASSVQFFLTDSSKNYLRGALYFMEEPRLDSIQPVLEFIKKDIDVMIKSFKWKN